MSTRGLARFGCELVVLSSFPRSELWTLLPLGTGASSVRDSERGAFFWCPAGHEVERLDRAAQVLQSLRSSSHGAGGRPAHHRHAILDVCSLLALGRICCNGDGARICGTEGRREPGGSQRAPLDGRLLFFRYLCARTQTLLFRRPGNW